MFFMRHRQPKRETALGLDIGTTQIKAVVVRKRDDKFELVEYATRTLPAAAMKSYKDPAFAAEIQQLIESLKTSERRAFVTISCSSAMVCQAEMPAIPAAEIKLALKMNSAKYLRRDLSNYYLDIFELTDHRGKDAPKGRDARKKVLVGGAAREEVDACRDALAAARIKPEVIELAAVSIINAFNATHPDQAAGAALLVDIGGRSTTINFLQQGEPAMTRIMHFGGVQLSEYVGQMLGVETNLAEQPQQGMDAGVQELLSTALSPLAREVRSSIDYFERQQACRVTRAFACGGSAASGEIVKFLGAAVGIEFQAWNLMEAFDTSGFNGDAPRLAALGPSLAAAIGVAVARLS